MRCTYSEEEKFTLIHKFRKSPCLWDRDNEHYKDQLVRERVLGEMCISLNTSGYII